MLRKPWLQNQTAYIRTLSWLSVGWVTLGKFLNFSVSSILCLTTSQGWEVYVNHYMSGS